jgi:hypothetical protein
MEHMFKGRAFTQRVHSFAEVTSKDRGLWTLNFFDSPKNLRRYCVRGDIAYCHLTLAEGDPRITRYEPLSVSENQTEFAAADVVFNDERMERWIFTYEKTAAKRDPISLGKHDKSVWKTEHGLKNRGILIENWLNLCSARNKAKWLSHAYERSILMTELEKNESLSLGEAFNCKEVDAAIMLSTIAAELAAGRISGALESAYIDPSFKIWR